MLYFFMTPKQVKCENCGRKFYMTTRQSKLTPAKHMPSHVFCSETCKRKLALKIAQKVSNTKRSKAEHHLENLIRTVYPKHELVCNDRNTLYSGLELDLHLRKLKIAIEINGPGHYTPIYGNESFIRTLKNDKDKARECKERGIKLIILDISKCTDWVSTVKVVEEFFNTIVASNIST